MDIQLVIRGNDRMLSGVLKEHFIDPMRLIGEEGDRAELKFRHGDVLTKVSALLFGPPGTSKTDVTRAIAREAGWPLITINPSDFVKGSFEEVYVKVDEIFRDMMDLAGVVIFFDEMDALMQSREGDKLDTATQFLTTVMLPKLAELHDRRQAVFFMATNHQDRFDPALKRAGRFDLLLCMGPPILDQKLEKIETFRRVKSTLKEAHLKQLRPLIGEYTKNDPSTKAQVELFTFAEFADFLERIVEDFGSDEFVRLTKESFVTLVNEFKKYAILNLEHIEKPLLEKIKKAEKLSAKDMKKAKENWIGMYYLDRNESSIH